MKDAYKVIALSVFFALFAWIADGICEYYASSQERSVTFALLDGPGHKIFVRCLVTLCFLIFGIVTVILLANRKRAEKAERRSRMVAEAISMVSLKYLGTGSSESMARVLVEQAVLITDAEFGCVVELDHQQPSRVLAISRKEEALTEKHVGGEQRPRRIEIEGASLPPFSESLLFTQMLQGASVLTNAPTNEVQWFESLPGAVSPIASFLAVPIKLGEELIAAIALANRSRGFTDRELHDIETLAGTAAMAFRAARSEEERTRAEEQLRQAAKMEAVGRLAGGIAHDFNNLLTVIMGYTELGQIHSQSTESEKRYFEEIEAAAGRGANLAKQLLAFSRRQRLEPQNVNIGDILLDMNRMLGRLIGEDIELETQRNENLWTVRVDPSQFQQVVVNLVINARDAMPEGGRLTLETANVHLDQEYARSHAGACPGDYAMLAVRDTGMGMTDGVKERAFEPFFTTKGPGKGTGFGLATCYGIVKQSDGYIWIESEPDRGTSIEVYLPRVEENATALGEHERSTEPLGGVETVLVVEDEPSVRELVAGILRSYGYAVLEGANGEEALQIAQGRSRETIHLLVTDVVMPRMGGKDLLRRLSTVRPDLKKVLFMSGHADTPIPHYQKTGARIAYLQKPFKPSVLAHKVREVLDAG